MKKLDLSSTTTTNIAYFTSGTIDFLQLAYQEGISAAIQAMIGASYNSSTVYVLYGCVSSVSGGDTSFSPGALFYNGEVFLYPVTPPIPTPGFIVTNLVTSHFTSDPLNPLSTNPPDPMYFSMTAPANVHNVRTVTFAGGSTGSGTLTSTTYSDYSNLVFLNNIQSAIINELIENQTGGMAAAFGAAQGTYTPVIMSGLVYSVTLGAPSITEGWFFYNGQYYYFGGFSGTSIPVGPVLVITLSVTAGLPTATAAYATSVTSGPSSFDYSTMVNWTDINTQNINQLIENQTGGMAEAFGAGAGTNTPIIMSGLGSSLSGGGITVNSGWVFYNGQFVYCENGFIGGVSGVTPVYNISTVNGLPTAYLGSIPTGTSIVPATQFYRPTLTWAGSMGTVLGLTTINSQISTINSEVSTLEGYVSGAWTNGGTLVYSGATGGGSVSIPGTAVIYNNYKLNGQTFYWQVQVRGATVTGTVDTFKLETPFDFYASGVSWANTGAIFPAAATGTAYSASPYILLLSILGQPYVQLGISDGSSFPIGSGALNFDINIIAEVS